MDIKNKIEYVKYFYQPWEELLFRYVLVLDLVGGKGRMEFVSHNLDEDEFLERWDGLKDEPTLNRIEYCSFDGPDDWKVF